jgi:hypothetical protein
MIKSGTSQAELDDYLGRFRRDGSCHRFFFVCHSATAALSLPAQPRLHLWTAERLSDAAIKARRKLEMTELVADLLIGQVLEDNARGSGSCASR